MNRATIASIIGLSGIAIIVWQEGWLTGLGLFLVLWGENLNNSIRFKR